MVSQTHLRQLQDIVGKERCLTAEEDRMVYSHDVYCESKPEVVVLPTTRDLLPALQACTADPLWLLARQQQFREFQGEDAYSYVYDGQMGYLDFAISGAMVSQVTGTEVWHVNADEPDLIDYDMSFKKDAQDLLYAADPYRYSDHDPVIIGLDLVYFEADGPYSVVENGTTTLTVPARKMDLNEGALTYAWDLDGDGVFETPGRTVTFSAAGLTAPQSLVVKVQATNSLGYSTVDAVVVNVIYDFRGFLGQVDNQPVLNIAIAGNVIPVKFSLVGDKGLDIFAAGTPTVEKVYCPITYDKNVVEKYVSLATPPLSYNATKDKYKFTWQTDAAWAGTCQLFTIELNDGTTHTALFKFK